MTDGFTNTIDYLFSTVLWTEFFENRVQNQDFITAIQNMIETYKPNPSRFVTDSAQIANYNDAAHRCAYLHKYAPLHTELVVEMLRRALKDKPSLFQNLISDSGSGTINLCSLGGGPGSDVIGVMSVFNPVLGPNLKVSATVIDIMPEWMSTFASVIDELRCGCYGALSNSVSESWFNWLYMGCDLMGSIPRDVEKAIGSADLLTMVKFVSAAACKDTSSMINTIFETIKPGAMIIFIDNAGGGFHEMVSNVAIGTGLSTVFGPIKHEHYINHSFKSKCFGFTPCYETKVSVQIWQKPLIKVPIIGTDMYDWHLNTMEPNKLFEVDDGIFFFW